MNASACDAATAPGLKEKKRQCPANAQVLGLLGVGRAVLLYCSSANSIWPRSRSDGTTEGKRPDGREKLPS